MHQLLCKKDKTVQSKNPTIPEEKPTNQISFDFQQVEPFVMQEDVPIVFPKQEINPYMIKLQVLVREFLTTVITHHEQIIYNIVIKNSYDKSILTTTNRTIIDMIVECTKSFYNKCYINLQNEVVTAETTNILEMSYYAQFSPHILLNKLIHLTLDIHIDVVRENLTLKDVDKYFSGIQTEIDYQFLSSVNLIHVLSKGLDENEDFINIGNGEKPFDVIIDKHIEK
uniref:Uncharacterized protein n=1 Tax=viral metagenome TaxID=1070528 RepID=A0A6C0C6C7_9ZZZZ